MKMLHLSRRIYEALCGLPQSMKRSSRCMKRHCVPLSEALTGFIDHFFAKKMVGVAGVEPATSCSQSKRASHCATPRRCCSYKILHLSPLFKFNTIKRLDFSLIKLILFNIRGENRLAAARRPSAKPEPQKRR